MYFNLQTLEPLNPEVMKTCTNTRDFRQSAGKLLAASGEQAALRWELGLADSSRVPSALFGKTQTSHKALRKKSGSPSNKHTHTHTERAHTELTQRAHREHTERAHTEHMA